MSEHSFLEMVRSRIYGILADYEDQHDHDALRHDPVFKLIAQRRPDAPPLASQPTWSRFANAITIASLDRLRDQFIASLATPPKHFGLITNSVLKNRSESLVEQAVAQFRDSRQPQRLFEGFWYQAGSWAYPRWVIVKAEANAQGTNRRFIVTHRPGARVVPAAAYDDYAARGEAENRNKELKCGLKIDRTSDPRFLANYFRLHLHGAADNLLVRLGRAFGSPPPVAAPTLVEPVPAQAVPTEARAGAARRRYFARRRQADPLGEGHPCTWRSLLIKVAAAITVSARRILVRRSASWPYLDWYLRLCTFVTACPVSSG